jgi:hypothetical protein
LCLLRKDRAACCYSIVQKEKNAGRLYPGVLSEPTVPSMTKWLLRSGSGADVPRGHH